MSTRRARIKAVTALPPRRKNAENNDNQPKPSQSNENVLTLTSVKSPPKAVNQDELSVSTSIALSIQNTPRHLIQDNSRNTPLSSQGKIIPASPYLKTISASPQKISITPKPHDRIPVFTSASSSRSIFASPQPRTVSPIKYIASPLNTQRRLTPRLTPTRPRLDRKCMSEILKTPEKKKKTPMDKSDTHEDYNIPSLPDSVTEETVMDGITSLQLTRSVPKPIDLLKNEIISENAEVLFDPIVPLPSPSKVRPKLRPAPRLAPLRRSSIQGSASESEDDSRRALLSSGTTTPAPPRQRHDSHTSHSTSLTNRDVIRLRNDSVSSNISQITSQLQPGSPMKEKNYSKSRRQEMARRMAAMRRRRETVKRDTLTMYDLIFYNPTTNPIVPDQEELNAKEANRKEAERAAEREESTEEEEPPEEEAPVPQIKLGPNGEIILDEKSLVIKQTSSKRKVSSVVREGSWGGTGGKYTRAARTADWSAPETVRFYRALAAIGTDFSLMTPLFPGRSRRDLKLKFKKEERINGAQVDKALRSATTWDAARLEEEFQEEREAADRKKKEREHRQRQEQPLVGVINVRRSRASKAMETTAHMTIPKNKDQDRVFSANDILQRALNEKLEIVKNRKEAAEAKQKAKAANALAQKPLTHKTPITGKSISNNMEISTPINNVVIDQSRTPTPNSMKPRVPTNVESGSLVVLTVDDPNSNSKKMFQTYITNSTGHLTPVALPPTFLNTVVGYMNKGTPKTNGESPKIASPLVDNRSATPSQHSPNKKPRHNSYTLTKL